MSAWKSPRAHIGGLHRTGKTAVSYTHLDVYKRQEEYTVDRILAVTEASLAPVACLDQTANACERRLECPTLPIWQGLERMIHDYLHGITLQDILDQSAARRCE